MKISILHIIKIELLKFLKRNDILAVAVIVAIGFIYAIGMRNEMYEGVKNQNALFWITLQLVTTTVLFIGPVVTAFLGTQMLSGEIDNKSISLFTVRIRNRRNLFIGKSLALHVITAVFFVITIIVMLAIYFGIANNGSIYTSGKIFGNNVADLLCLLLLIYMYTFFFIPQLALCIGTRYKPIITIVISFVASLVCNHVLTYSFVKYINPMNYIYQLSEDVLETTEVLSISSTGRGKCVLIQLLLCMLYYVVFMVLGTKSFEGREF